MKRIIFSLVALSMLAGCGDDARAKPEMTEQVKLDIDSPDQRIRIFAGLDDGIKSDDDLLRLAKANFEVEQAATAHQAIGISSSKANENGGARICFYTKSRVGGIGIQGLKMWLRIYFDSTPKMISDWNIKEEVFDDGSCFVIYTIPIMKINPLFMI